MKFYISFTGRVSFQDLGLPGNVIESWHSDKLFSEHVEMPKPKPKPLKNGEIPLLKDYGSDPGEEFWNKFPFNPLPSEGALNTPISVDEFEKLYLRVQDRMTFTQRHSALSSINNLRYGADSLVDLDKLYELHEHNAPNMSRADIGCFYTDQLVSLIKKKFVSGPFLEPPIENLRVNKLFCVEQSDKFRPILHLSHPKKNCFNRAIIDEKMTRVKMSSPAIIAEKLYCLGRGSVMSKIDHSSAYKLIPTKLDHLFLQGFYYLDRFYVETSQIFGARSAVPNYDGFSKDVALICEILSEIDPYFLERQLDDNITLTPTLEENQRFVNKYLEIAELINLPLAPYNNPEKAFLFQTVGTVLGVIFDTNSMTWKLCDEKRFRYMATIQNVLSKVKVTKLDMQTVLGMLNTMTLLCKPLKFLRAPLVDDLKRTYVCDIILSDASVSYLHKWLHIIQHLSHGFPLPMVSPLPPAMAISFVTDAAGGASLSNKPGLKVGVGACAFIGPLEDDLLYVSQCLWPDDFIRIMKDSTGKSFGNKTTLLEAIGVLVPYYHNFRHIRHKHVVSYVDNVGTVWAFRNGKSRTDLFTSVIVTALHYVLMSQACMMYVEHLPRVSSMPAVYADVLSRSNEQGMYLLKSFDSSLIRSDWPPSLLAWLSKPTLDWNLGAKLLRDCRMTL